MSADALLVVPPLLKHIGGPLLGPAMLVAAAQAAGHTTRVLDLATEWLLDGDPDLATALPLPFVGDHDRPSVSLRAAQHRFLVVAAPLLPPPPPSMPEDRVLTLPYDHDSVLRAAERLVDGPWGAWIRGRLTAGPRPDLVGISALYGGQVLWGIATALIVRRWWPGTPVVWGGAHVTALHQQIATDAAYAKAGDGFVVGYAERTWAELLDAVSSGSDWPPEVLRPGGGHSVRAHSDASLSPSFDVADLDRRQHVTLPAQASRGCAYGRCAYCTYPAIEGGYRPLDPAGWMPVIELAEARGARVSFKDSLLVPRQLEEIAARVAGRVPWSACTKLHPRLNHDLLERLAMGGLRTLEIGLETLSPQGQLVIDKRQSPHLFCQLLDAAETTGVCIVVNTITGFPGVDPSEADYWQQYARRALVERPGLVAKVEHNRFQLERLSPMALHPARHGLEIVESWPWATVVAWRPAAAALPRAVA